MSGKRGSQREVSDRDTLQPNGLGTIRLSNRNSGSHPSRTWHSYGGDTCNGPYSCGLRSKGDSRRGSRQVHVHYGVPIRHLRILPLAGHGWPDTMPGRCHSQSEEMMAPPIRLWRPDGR